MQGIKTEWILWGVGIGAVLVLLPGLLNQAGKNIGGSVPAVADGALDGLANLVQNHSPVPDTRTATSRDRCREALAAGDDLKASFFCPAADWLGGLFDGEWF